VLPRAAERAKREVYACSQLVRTYRLQSFIKVARDRQGLHLVKLAVGPVFTETIWGTFATLLGLRPVVLLEEKRALASNS